MHLFNKKIKRVGHAIVKAYRSPERWAGRRAALGGVDNLLPLSH